MESNTTSDPNYIPKNIIYEIEINMFSIAHDFITDSLRYLQYECGFNERDIRVSMPKRFIEAMICYNRERYSFLHTNFPTKYNNITVVENYKNEIAVFCIYFEKYENDLIKILNLNK